MQGGPCVVAAAVQRGHREEMGWRPNKAERALQAKAGLRLDPPAPLVLGGLPLPSPSPPEDPVEVVH